MKATEDYFRVKFPASFRSFLEQWNGATPKSRTFDTAEGTERRIERFLPLLDRPADAGDDGWYDITVVHTQIEERLVRDPDVLGSDLVPIAELFAGDFVCLDFGSGGAEVVVWDHEESEEFAPALVPVAPDFESFLAMLR